MMNMNLFPNPIRISVCVCLVCSVSLFAVGQPETARRSEIRALELEPMLEQLRSDEIRFNAIHATLVLYEYMDEVILQRMHELLDSDDWQQRQLAAWLIRREQPVPLTERLVEVTVEGMRDDSLPESWHIEVDGYSYPPYTPFFNASDGVRTLLAVPLKYPQPLVDALDSDDWQQQFWAAFVLACKQHQPALEQAVAVLATHLMDDSTRRNAYYAAHAIYEAGPGVRAQIEALFDSADAQQRDIARLIVASWDDPRSSATHLPEGIPRPTYVDTRWNPLFEIYPRYSIYKR